MGRTLKIVVADDDRDNREFLHTLLRHLGHEVRPAGDRSELVRLCDEFHPDLVVSAHALPGLDGGAVALEVSRTGPAPVILTLRRSEVVRLDHLGHRQVCRVLLKPVRPIDLVAAVEEVLSAFADREGQASPPARA